MDLLGWSGGSARSEGESSFTPALAATTTTATTTTTRALGVGFPPPFVPDPHPYGRSDHADARFKFPRISERIFLDSSRVAIP